MIGILTIAGHQRKLLSLTTSYSKTVCKRGMVTTLEIFARERVYDHKFIINSESYAIRFDYVKTK